MAEIKKSGAIGLSMGVFIALGAAFGAAARDRTRSAEIIGKSSTDVPGGIIHAGLYKTLLAKRGVKNQKIKKRAFSKTERAMSDVFIYSTSTGGPAIQVRPWLCLFSLF